MIALGIGLEEYEYPYAVQFLPLSNDLQLVTMAYMDIPPTAVPNGRTVVLFHGKAFGCYYFHSVIEALTGAGYRVVAPDQIGWGKSAKPDIHYSFQLLAANTAALLDHLGVGPVAVLGHSTGGMTATRFTLMNPDRVTHLVLEDPLGLVDYRTGIPPQSEETLYDHEVHWTDPAVIRGYVAGYFVHPDPGTWEPLADVLVRVTLSPDYPRWARAAALTFQMIYQQPVRYEYHQIAPPTLLIVGAEDHVVPLGQYAKPAELARLGDFIALSTAAARDIPRATRVVIPDCGHIPHLEQPSQFLAQLLPFLEDDHAAGLHSAAFPARDSEPGDETTLALRRDRHRRGAAPALAAEGKFAAVASTAGYRIANALVTLQAPVSDTSTLAGRPTVNLRHFPSLAAGQQDKPAVHELVMALFDDQAVTQAWAGTSELDYPEVPGEELHDLAPVRNGAGFRFELSYTVTDLRTLQ